MSSSKDDNENNNTDNRNGRTLSFGDSECRGRITELFKKVALHLLGFFVMVFLCNAVHYFLRPFSQPRITSDIVVSFLLFLSYFSFWFQKKN